MFLTQPGPSTMLGPSGPTSQKDWYPHPKSGLRSISQLAKYQISVRPVKVESPYRISETRCILKPDSLDNTAQQNAIDNRMITGEMRILFPANNVSPAKNGAEIAKANDVFDWLNQRSIIAMTAMMTPKACRRPRQSTS